MLFEQWIIKPLENWFIETCRYGHSKVAKDFPFADNNIWFISPYQHAVEFIFVNLIALIIFLSSTYIATHQG